MAGDKNHTALRPHGTIIVTDPEIGRTLMKDTLCCVHCHAHWVVKPGSGKMRGWCGQCNGPTCSPRCTLKCVPEEVMLENMEQGRPLDYRPTVVSVPAQPPE